MPWISETEFKYTKTILKNIAEGYIGIYDGLRLGWKSEVYNLWALAEYKADFDMALSSIGRGKWEGVVGHQLSDYREFGRLQRIIIANIIGERLNGGDIPRLRGYAYYLMVKKLNG